MKSQNQLFFEASAEYHKIPLKLANKIIDGRYRPFLSALNDQYYDNKGSTVWDAKFYALDDAIKQFGVKGTIKKLKEIK